MICEITKAGKKEHEIISSVPHRLIRKSELKRLFGDMPDATLYRLISEKKIPPAIHMSGGRTAFWVESEILEILKNIISDANRGEVQ
jgi:predicted DNA-binding transcriptional regulator AlpA